MTNDLLIDSICNTRDKKNKRNQMKHEQNRRTRRDEGEKLMPECTYVGTYI